MSIVYTIKSTGRGNSMITEMIGISICVGFMMKLTKTPQGNLKRKWNRIMESAKKQNKLEETYQLYNIEKTEYGFRGKVEIPDGLSLETFEKLKPVLESNLGCRLEMKSIKYTNQVNLKIIKKDFDNKEYVPVKCKPYEVFLGYDTAGEPVIVNMNRFPHVLIAGITGSGKSRLLFIILTNLIYSSNSGQIEVNLCSIAKKDLKKFKNCKQVISYNEDINDILKCYEELDKELDRRDKILDQAGVDNIEEYNQSHRNKMRYVYVFADEFSFYQPDDSDTEEEAKAKKAALAYLKNFIKRGRGYGLFVIMGIQVTTHEEMPTIIRRNAYTHITFKQQDAIASRIIIGTDDATKLELREAICSTDHFTYFRTPTITKEIIDEHIKSSLRDIKKDTSDKSNEFQSNFTIKELTKEEYEKLKARGFKQEKKENKPKDYSMGYGQLPKRKGVVKHNVNAEG